MFVDVSCCLLVCIVMLQLQKLVSTQEALQQQLTVQLDAGNAASDSHKQELQSLAEELKSAQQQLEEAQAAAAALAGELQVRFVSTYNLQHTGV